MAYVDLNPVRAGIASQPETSEYTSIRERIEPEFNLDNAVQDQAQCGDLFEFNTPLKPLLPFEGGQRGDDQAGILFDFEEYLQLVDWTGRIIRRDKRGSIDEALPPILTRLQITSDRWCINATQFEAIHARRFNRIATQLDTG
jgi:hypothetical protein